MTRSTPAPVAAAQPPQAAGGATVENLERPEGGGPDGDRDGDGSNDEHDAEAAA